jgi:hypothetical protein
VGVSSLEAPCFDYGIDANDILVSLSDEWLEFARANGAGELTRERLIGRSLWQFVADDGTQKLYEAIFHRARRHCEEVTVPFRCDSPDLFRFMHLVISPNTGGDIELCGRMLREQKRPYLSILDRMIEHTTEALPICSVCLRMEIQAEKWVEPEQAVARLELFDAPKPPELDYRVCPDCVRKARRPVAIACD